MAKHIYLYLDFSLMQLRLAYKKQSCWVLFLTAYTIGSYIRLHYNNTHTKAKRLKHDLTNKATDHC